MKDFFDEVCNSKLYEHDGHTLYSINYRYVSESLVKKWSRNRDCDEKRVEEMEEFYLTGGYIPRMLCLANIKGEGLVCYDGNHRRCMFERLYNLGDEFNCEVIVDIMFDVTQEQVYTAFENVNKSVQVPAIYLDDDLSKVKDDIIKLVNTFCTRYKEFC
jgi:hypothetical protein